MLKIPPGDITPARFFETWLPAEYDRLVGELPAKLPDIALAVELTGEGGGSWTVTLAGGELTVSPGTGEDPAVKAVQSVADWRAVTTGGAAIGMPSGSPAGPPVGSVDQLLLHPAFPQIATAFHQVQGTVDLEVSGSPGDSLAVRLIFHGAAEPYAKISISAAAVAEIQAGTLTAPEAFFAGKITVTGDTALAMQLGMMLIPLSQSG